jgi:hypothetical protein
VDCLLFGGAGDSAMSYEEEFERLVKRSRLSLWAHTVWLVMTAACFIIALPLFPLGYIWGKIKALK